MTTEPELDCQVSPIMIPLARTSRRIVFGLRDALPLVREKRFFHFSYHKSLTALYGNVMRGVMSETMPGMYKHFNSDIDAFYREAGILRGASVNNHRVDFGRLPPFRASHFIRDPRDLVVSGYHYHKRGAENWCHIKNPTEADWYRVNGFVPSAIQPSQSFTEYLNSVDAESGLLAEVDFRRYHFEAMDGWPYGHPDILELRYEDVVGNEITAFTQIAEFLELPGTYKKLMIKHAANCSLQNVAGNTKHVRNAAAGQWKKAFTPKVRNVFRDKYGPLLIKLRYEESLDW